MRKETVFHKKRLGKQLCVIMIVLLILFFWLAHLFDLDDRVHVFWMNWTTSQKVKDKSVWISSYKAEIEGKPIPGVRKNVSGITYNYDSNTLWIITNEPQELIELSLDIEVLRRIALKNFSDTEAVAYIGNGTFVVADERDMSIVLAPVSPETTTLDRELLRFITMNSGGTGNNGLEGIAYDPSVKTIYAVQERKPLKLFAVSGFAEGKKGVSIGVPDFVDIDEYHLDDLSGLHFDSATGHLLLLSDEAKLLVEVDADGVAVSFLELESGFNGLKKDIPQAEGVTLDSQGNLYIVSEPNLLYKFQKYRSHSSVF